ncbi:MAG: endonuclease domain-containing protein [Rhizobiales bacterium]|nr:endonuclease domain-containing protein [Hyphomicrobiales bacterium]
MNSPSYPLPLRERVARAVRPEPGEGSVAQGIQHRPVAKRNRSFAKAMRRSATGVELAMWRLLRHRRLVGFKFRRQVPIEGFIVDFVCFDQKVIVEIDGSQHFASQRDERRDAVLTGEGFRILRYWNNDVLQRRTSVLEDLFAHLTDDKR